MSGVSGAREFAAAIRHAASDITSGAEKVVEKGALNVKKDLQKQLQGSRSFRGIARSITYDRTGLSAEIGPDKSAGAGGALANIAYWGGSGWGVHSGGTVEDPGEALKREEPFFEKYLMEEAVKSFD